MKCPYCRHNGKAKVVDARPSPKGYRRRRECANCGRRFTTRERVADPAYTVDEPCPTCGGRGLVTRKATDVELRDQEDLSR